MALVFMIFAALLTATTNLVMRRSIDEGGSNRAYLVVQFFFSLIVSLILGPVRVQAWIPELSVVIIGAMAGLFLAFMMWSLGRSLTRGPPGLTFAAVNSAAVIPAIVMFAVFGKPHGFDYQIPHALGSVLVVVGLFWAGATGHIQGGRFRWAMAVLSSCGAYVLLICSLQWRSLLLSTDTSSYLIPFHLDAVQAQWFNPVLFLVATLFQLIQFLILERRVPKKREVIYGVVGGTLNGGATWFLVAAPVYASPLEQAMIFPLYAVVVIILSNLWGARLYREKVNWLANAVCLLGVFLGTVSWASIF